MEDKIKMLNDEEKNKDDDNLPTTDGVSAHINDLQLSKQPMAFGNPQDDELVRGGKKDKKREADMELEIANFLKDLDIQKSPEEGFVLDLKKSNDSASIARHLMRI